MRRRGLILLGLLLVLVTVSVAVAYASGYYVGSANFPTTCLFGRERARFDVYSKAPNQVHAHFNGPGGGTTSNKTVGPDSTVILQWTATGTGLDITDGDVHAVNQQPAMPSIVATYNWCGN